MTALPVEPGEKSREKYIQVGNFVFYSYSRLLSVIFPLLGFHVAVTGNEDHRAPVLSPF